jgi:hypothetical protein
MLQPPFDGTIGSRRPIKEVLVPDDNKSGNRENESRKSPGRDLENERSGSSASERERDSKGRFESDDDRERDSKGRFESGDNFEGGSSRGSQGSSKKK